MRFTIRGQEIETEIKHYLDITCQVILKYLPVRSILLTGSFGKGEGSVEIVNGKVYPLNDFDIYTVVDKKIDEDLIFLIENEVCDLLGLQPYDEFETTTTQLDTFMVDIKCFTKKQICSLPPLLKFYEMKHASQVLYGENSVEYIPDYSIGDIPLSDGARFLLNRMCYTLHTFSTEYLDGKIPDNGKTMIYGCHKALCECATALLLLKGEMAATYQERSRIFSRIYFEKHPDLSLKIPDLPQKIAESTDFKLAPTFQKYDPVKLWFETRNIIKEIIRYYLEMAFQIKANNEVEFTNMMDRFFYRRYIRPYLDYLIKSKIRINCDRLTIWASTLLRFYLNLKYALRLRKYEGKTILRSIISANPPDTRIYMASFLLYVSIREDGTISTRLLDEASKYTNSNFPALSQSSLTASQKWNLLREANGTAYRLFFGQKII